MALTLEQAREIAKQTDPKATLVTDFPKGYHFMRKEDEYNCSDPGFAISKENGKIYFGFAAQVFLRDLFEEK
ncbi:MAG: hypothetical protein IJK98_11105 [Clostridia bacterium]|nr:hypothetical protein [Clostridia bacterium]MBQ7687875.1 hypothetical protein [Clostridia bacterium]